MGPRLLRALFPVSGSVCLPRDRARREVPDRRAFGTGRARWTRRVYALCGFLSPGAVLCVCPGRVVMARWLVSRGTEVAAVL